MPRDYDYSSEEHKKRVAALIRSAELWMFRYESKRIGRNPLFNRVKAQTIHFSGIHISPKGYKLAEFVVAGKKHGTENKIRLRHSKSNVVAMQERVDCLIGRHAADNIPTDIQYLHAAKAVLQQATFAFRDVSMFKRLRHAPMRASASLGKS